MSRIATNGRRRLFTGRRILWVADGGLVVYLYGLGNPLTFPRKRVNASAGQCAARKPSNSIRIYNAKSGRKCGKKGGRCYARGRRESFCSARSFNTRSPNERIASG